MVVKILLHNFGAEIRKKPMNIKLISLLNLLKSINHSRFIAIALYFTLFIILLDIFYVIYNTLYQISTLDEFICNMTSNSSNSIPQDPVRYWPSGVPQNTSIIGATLATYLALRKSGLSPRVGGIFALTAGVASATVVTAQSIIENPVGFIVFSRAVARYKQEGRMPTVSEVENIPSPTQAEADAISKWVKESLGNKDFVKKLEEVSDPETSELLIKAKEAWDSQQSGNSFLGSSNSIFDKILNFYQTLYQFTIDNIKMGSLEGHLDELIGQRIFFEFIIFISVLAIFYLFLAFLFNLFILLNKNKILNFFTNKYILLVVKYEIALSKIVVYVAPILILVILINILIVSFWMVSNPIPYEDLGIDLHQYIKSK